jgi:hypothetical protein
VTVNKSARRCLLTIAGKDFTPALLYFAASDSHINQSGLVTTTGTIELGFSGLIDESLDDRKNSRFCRGNSIIIEIENDNGELVKHPRGALRILSATYSEDNFQKRQSLEVGCLISLLNFKEPLDTEKADNKGCDGKTAGEIIVTLLREAGILHIGGILPNTIYNYPLRLSGSYLNSVGQILYANGLIGYIDKNGVFQIIPDKIRWQRPELTIRIGYEEIWYKRLTGAELPVDKVAATGTEIIVRDAAETSIDISETYGAASIIDKNYSSSDEIVIERTKTTRAWNKSTHQLIVTKDTYKPYGLVIPSVFFGENQSKLAEILASREVETSSFEKDTECKLKSKTTKFYYPRATYLSEYKEANPNYIFFGLITPQLVKEIKEFYIYDIKNRIKSIRTNTEELKISILNNTEEDWSSWEFPPEDPIPPEESVQRWNELATNYWEYSTSKLSALVRVNPEAVVFTAGSKISSNKTDLISNPEGSGTKRSNVGQTQPPATERCPDHCNYEENNIEEIALFSGICNPQFRERQRNYTVEFLAGRKEPPLQPGSVVLLPYNSESQAAQQLKAVALNEGLKLYGRYKGQIIAVAMSNPLFDYHPLFNIEVIEQDGSVQNFASSAGNWVLNQSECYANFYCFWITSSFRGNNPIKAISRAFGKAASFPYNFSVTETITSALTLLSTNVQSIPFDVITSMVNPNITSTSDVQLILGDKAIQFNKTGVAVLNIEIAANSGIPNSSEVQINHWNSIPTLSVVSGTIRKWAKEIQTADDLNDLFIRLSILSLPFYLTFMVRFPGTSQNLWHKCSFSTRIENGIIIVTLLQIHPD